MNVSSKPIALLVVALLLVTAGCSGDGGPATTSPPSSEVPTSAAPTTTPTETTPTTTAPPSGELQFPHGFSRAGINLSVRVIEPHYQILANTSYTQRHVRYSNRSSGLIRMNFTSDRALLNYTSLRGRQFQIYADRGTGYRRYVMNESWTYDTVNMSLRSVRNYFSTIVADTYGTANYTYVGPVTHDGMEVHRYEMTGVRDNVPGVDVSNLSNVSGYLEVRPDGLIVDYEWTGEHQGEPLKFRYNITEVGETTIVRPAWVETEFENVSG